MQLNEEQTAAVQHPLGQPACLIAGAGSGKTRVLTERVRWLMGNDVPPQRICAITFTNKAAGELIHRLGLDSTAKSDVPRVSTIHSLALSGIRRNPQAFGLKDKVTPLDDYDQKQMVKKIIERHKFEDDTTALMFKLLDKISFHRARGVGFRKEYTEDVHIEALRLHAGYHAMDETELELWEEFEHEKRENSVVDFDDMLHLVVRRMRTDPQWLAALHRQFSHVLMDEAQDTNPVQWEFINGLLHPDNPNLYVVGDMGQCQPPGTMVKVKVADHKPHGHGKAWTPSEWIEKDIATLTNGELVASWTRKDQRSYKVGRKIRVASRPYSGLLWRIRTADGKVTRVTPNHKLWVRFNPAEEGKHIVYLMWREHLGFRVGMAKLKRHSHAFGLTTRMRQEKADKGWVLAVVDSREEALQTEAHISVHFGIPDFCFKTSEARLEIFHKLGTETAPESRSGRGGNGWACLKAFNLLWDFPLMKCWTKEERQYNHNWRGYFLTAAANVKVLADAGLMSVPIEGNNKSTPILLMARELYEGPVYSLDVEKDHTYVADGIVVGNSIYGFNGAVPRILKDYSENWRGMQPVLYHIARNHRSVPEIVDFANLIQQKMTHTLPLRMESWRGMNKEHGEVRKLVATFPQTIAAIIAAEIQRDSRSLPYKDNALLVRSGIQIRDLETELIKRRIPYIVRGGRGLLTTEEVRDIMAYMRLTANHKDFMSFVRACGAPRCGVGEVTLEKIRQQANEKFDGDLIQASHEHRKLAVLCDVIDHASMFKETPIAVVEKIMAMTGYKDYIRQKYRKEPGRVQAKIENIERFAMMVIALVQEGTPTLDDLIFQLTLDRPKMDEAAERQSVLRAFDEGEITEAERDAKLRVIEQGSVTITTIHSAKGLEWKRVYVTNLVEGSLPHKFSMGSESEIEEERRLFYVACTRARDFLVWCVPERLVAPEGGPKKSRLVPSRFLTEIGA